MEGYTGLRGYIYKVSNFGRVLSVRRQVIWQSRLRWIGGNILIGFINRGGYKNVSICKDNTRVIGKIHRLVAQAFILNPDNKPCVNHKNGTKTDNRAENLEWVTHSENTEHSYKIGTSDKKGVKNTSCKLTEKQVLEIRKKYRKGRTKTNLFKLAEKYKVNYRTVNYIINRVTWKHI